MTVSHPPITPPRNPLPRPPLPALRLSIAPRRLGPSAVVAILVHVVVIGALIWERTTYLQGTVGGDGPQGGGGRGGQQLRYVTLPPAAAAPAVAAPRAPVADVPLPVPQALQLPEPTRIEITPMTITPPAVTVIGSGPGGGGGPGGGTGSTTGTGTGTDQGPGSGGDGGYIIPAKLIAANFPMCERGRRDVRLWVGADGRVNRVEIDPPPTDAACRREFSARMQQYRFEPAMTRDGRKVASVFKVTVER